MKYDSEINQKAVKDGRKKNYRKAMESLAIFKNKNNNNNNKIQCDENWDNCVDIKKRYDPVDFIVYQKKGNIEIIENYYIKKYKRNNSVKLKKNLKNLPKLINKYYEYDKLRVQRRQHECILAKRKKIRSAIKLNKDISKNTIEGKYKFDTAQKNKKEVETKIDDNKINNENDEEDDYNDILINNLIYDF